jgi:asparagine synthase (glutamine-hydrolysing)
VTTTRTPPGLIAVSTTDPGTLPDLGAMTAVLAGTDSDHVESRMLAHSALVLHGVEAGLDAEGRAVALLSCGPRRHERDLDVDDITTILAQRDVAGVLPPFAAATWDADGSEVVVATDRLGFRHMYVSRHPRWSAVSTGARVLANAEAVEIDRTAVAVQSMLGWQVGTRTMFANVDKVAAGQLVALDSSLITEQDTADGSAPEVLKLGAAVARAADLLREYLEAYLDDHPDAVLQLTGGQDSRVLLSAIPESRRPAVEVMTLAVEGTPDAVIAADIAARFGMTHRVVDLSGLESVSADEAHRMALTAAARLDCAADPLASAAIAFAEAKLDQRPRLSGLGGEVTRGFYYMGPPRQSSVTRQRVERLAKWRLFTNEAVPQSALGPAFVEWARDVTLSEIEQIFRSYGTDWLTATDRFYLGERMHRWAGVLATATSMDRAVVNPMLDNRFLAIAEGLHPRDKHSSRFLSGLSVALDPELARIPMDGRPAPEIYATRSTANYARLAMMTGRKITGKIRQRALGRRRAPAGGDILAAKVADWYRDHPEALEPVRRLGIFNAEWMEQFVEGTVPAEPASLAMLVNLELATSVPVDAGFINRA